jgi:fructose-1,6-bisphosphatase/inositol monophosphatase family enzyme
VILAVLDGPEVVYGLLYDPTFDDWIEARPGEGAWLAAEGRAPRRLTSSEMMGPVGGASGFVGLYLFPKADQGRIASTLDRIGRAGSLRCSCHEYRLMVQGRADYVLNGQIKPWDHAAGVLCLREAGGVARLLDGREYAPTFRDGHLLTAGTDALWQMLAEMWEAAG